MSLQRGQEFLAHYGVLGMKWGKRKDRSGGRVKTPRPVSDDSTKAAEYRKKARRYGTSALSNAELKALNTRLQLAKQYKDLSKSDKSAGQRFIEQTLANTGKQVVSQILSNATSSVVKAAMETVKK